MKHVPVTDEVREQIIAARREGKLFKEIAEEFGISRPCVNHICLEAGLKTYRKYERRTLSQTDKENRLEELTRLLLHEKTDPVIIRVGHLIDEMLEAGEGGTFYSDGRVGLGITATEIEIVDTRTGAIASLQLHFKKQKKG